MLRKEDEPELEIDEEKLDLFSLSKSLDKTVLDHLRPFNETVKGIEPAKLDVTCRALLFNYRKAILSVIDRRDGLSLRGEAASGDAPIVYPPGQSEWDALEKAEKELDATKETFTRCIKK